MKLVGKAHAFRQAGAVVLTAKCPIGVGCFIMVQGCPGVHRIDTIQIEHENRRQIGVGTAFAFKSATLDVRRVGSRKPIFLLEEDDIETIAALQKDMRRGREGSEVSCRPGPLSEHDLFAEANVPRKPDGLEAHPGV